MVLPHPFFQEFVTSGFIKRQWREIHVIRQPLKELAFVGGEHGDFFLPDAGDVDHDGRFKGARPGEFVVKCCEDGHFVKVWGFRADGGDGEQIGGVDDGLAGGAVVGVIILWPVCEHEVGLESADKPNESVSEVGSVPEVSVGLVADVVLGPDDGGGIGGFQAATLDESGPERLLVARFAVGYADHADDVAELAIESGQAAGGIFSVVGVGTNDENSEGVVRD